MRRTVGFVVDAVTEVLRLDEASVASAPQCAGEVDSALVRGIGKLGERLVIVLNLEEVFDFSQLMGLAS